MLVRRQHEACSAEDNHSAVTFCRFLEAELMKNTKHTYHGASYMYKVRRSAPVLPPSPALLMYGNEAALLAAD